MPRTPGSGGRRAGEGRAAGDQRFYLLDEAPGFHDGFGHSGRARYRGEPAGGAQRPADGAISPVIWRTSVPRRILDVRDGGGIRESQDRVSNGKSGRTGHLGQREDRSRQPQNPAPREHGLTIAAGPPGGNKAGRNEPDCT
jgi:hypothetical protein